MQFFLPDMRMCECGAGDKVGYILTNAELKIYWNVVVMLSLF